jgi:hypothetical protein
MPSFLFYVNVATPLPSATCGFLVCVAGYYSQDSGYENLTYKDRNVSLEEEETCDTSRYGSPQTENGVGSWESLRKS